MVNPSTSTTTTTSGSSTTADNNPSSSSSSSDDDSWTFKVVIQEHVWRISLIMAGIAMMVPKSSILSRVFGTAGSNEDSSTMVTDSSSRGLTTTSSEVTMTCLTLLLVIWLYGEISLAIRRTKLPPGKLGWPLLGHTINFLASPSAYFLQMKQKLGTATFTANVFEPAIVCGEARDLTWLWNMERKGKAVTDWPPAVLNLTGPNAILNLNGKAHRSVRQLFNPAFTPKSIRDYTKIIDETTMKFFDMLDEKAAAAAAAATTTTTTAAGPPASTATKQDDDDDDDGSSSYYHESDMVFRRFATNLLFVTAFGAIDDTTLDDIMENMKLWGDGLFSPISLRIPGTSYDRACTAREKLLSIYKQMIEDFKTKHNEDVVVPPPSSNNDDEVQNDSSSGQQQQQQAKKVTGTTTTTTTTMMGRLCSAVDDGGNPIKMEILLDNLLSIIFAGHDTTNKSMGTVIYFLNQHPEIKKAITDEVRNDANNNFLLSSKLDDDDDDEASSSSPFFLDYDKIKDDAPVLNAFIAETWRVLPPAVFAVRRMTKGGINDDNDDRHDDDDENNNQNVVALFRNKWKIPKGQMFLYSASLPLYDETIYPNPEKLLIERFLPKDHPMVIAQQQQQQQNNDDVVVDDKSCCRGGLDPNGMSSTYPVFSSGSVHGCLGVHFARLVMRIFLTRLLQRYDDIIIRNEKRVHIPVNGWECQFKLIPRSFK